jgi:hypothetical protein
MTDEHSRVRLHDVQITGVVTDRVAVLAAVERAIADSVPGEETRVDTETVRDAIATEVTSTVTP